MSTPAMHLEGAGEHGRTEKACRTCGTSFVARRSWAAFCSPSCRNAFHVAEARLDKIRTAAPALYEALCRAREAMRGKDIEHIWTDYPANPGISLGEYIDKVLATLKPPVEPKALLEKAKA